MKPLRRVLVGTDFTAGATRAARRALELPLAPRAVVELLHAAPRIPSRDFEAAVGRAARDALDRQAAGLRRGGTGPAPDLREALATGPPAESLAREARARRAELVVVGPRGEPGIPDLDLGSSAERLLAECEVPVLVVRRATRGPYRHALVAMDLARSSAAALALAMRLLGERGRVTLLHVIEPPVESGLRLAGTSAAERRRLRDRAVDRVEGFLAAEAGRVLRSELEVEYTIGEGDPRRVLLAATRRLRADLIALGTRRARDRSGFLLGSVARWVARRATCDVLVARAGRVDRSERFEPREPGRGERKEELDSAPR